MDETLRGRCILLAEDNLVNMELVKYFLENAEAEVITAENGERAVALFESSETGSIDAIVMDVEMPVMDGLTATKMIRAMERADARNIPIIAITGGDMEEDRTATMEAGMNWHLVKPASERKLVRIILRLSEDRENAKKFGADSL